MKYETVLFEHSGPLAILTINRPEKLNALSETVFREIKDVLTALRLNPDIRGLILTGAGDKAFVAGADILAMSRMSPQQGEEFSRLAQEITLMLEDLPFPVIAAVNGYALGGGCELAMACDFIYATENAVFAQPEVNLGLIPGFGGCVRLSRYVGGGLAKEMIYTGRRLDAYEAAQAGLVNRVFPGRTEVIGGAVQTLRQIFSKSRTAVNVCKTVINNTYARGTSDALAAERQGFRKVFESDEKAEGVAAFLEKRAPNF